MHEEKLFAPLKVLHLEKQERISLSMDKGAGWESYHPMSLSINQIYKVAQYQHRLANLLTPYPQPAALY